MADTLATGAGNGQSAQTDLTSPPATSGAPSRTPDAVPAGSPNQAQATPPGASPTSGATDTGSKPAGAGTLADQSGEDDAPAATPGNWPANWRDIMAGGDAKLLSRLYRFASPVNVFKSWAAAQQKLSSGELLRSKPDGEDEAALNEWRAQAGIPEKSDGYLENLPKGLVIGEADKPLVDGFLKDMHAQDAPPGVVQKALQWYYTQQEQIAADRAQADKDFRVKSEDALRSEWGPEFRSNINAINNLLDVHGDAELKSKFFNARTMDGRAFGDDPAMLKFLVNVSREINPHGTVTPNAGQTMMQTVQTELATLRKEMADTNPTDPNSYWRNPAKQARFLELTEIEDRAQRRQT